MSRQSCDWPSCFKRCFEEDRQQHLKGGNARTAECSRSGCCRTLLFNSESVAQAYTLPYMRRWSDFIACVARYLLVS
eukprot:310127-Prorocentrum_minimum.AAC.1